MHGTDTFGGVVSERLSYRVITLEILRKRWASATPPCTASVLAAKIGHFVVLHSFGLKLYGIRFRQSWSRPPQLYGVANAVCEPVWLS